jgi:hypothetical protein
MAHPPSESANGRTNPASSRNLKPPALAGGVFTVSRDKLIAIPAFAWTYWKYSAAKNCVISMKAWQVVRRWSLIAQYSIRSYALKLRAAESPPRINFHSR